MSTLGTRSFCWLLIAVLLTGILLVFPPVAVYANEGTDTLISDAESLRAELETQESTLPLKLEADIALTVDTFCEVWCQVVGEHTLDLNGHSFKVINTANLKGGADASDSTLFALTEGASLTIVDSSESKTGAISYSAGIFETPDDTPASSLTKLTGRHLFLVENGASLSIFDGRFSAGEVTKQWIHRGITYKNEQFEFFTDFSDYVVYGTVITVSEGGTLSISGGKFMAHGTDRTSVDPYNKGWEEAQPASVCVRALSGSKVTINNGRFEGNAGADVFRFEAEASISVRAGEFVNTPAISERLADMDGFAFVAGTDVVGDVLLPLSCIPSLSSVTVSHGDTILSDLKRNETLMDSEGIVYTVRPKEGLKTAITSPDLRSGMYTLGNKGTLSASYTPYFSTGSDIFCEWYFTNASGTTISVPTLRALTLDLNTLSTLEGCSLNRGEKYVFYCVITETNANDPTNALTTITEAYTLSVTGYKTVAAVSLSPSSVGDNNQYIAGKQAPSFSPISKSNFKVKSTTWYRYDETTSLGSNPILQPYEHYIAVFTLTASSGYVFSNQTRVTFIPGGTNASIAASPDGSTATVTVHFTTGCSHSSTAPVVTSDSHATICSLCGVIVERGAHTFGDWQNDVSPILENSPEIMSEEEPSDPDDNNSGSSAEGGGTEGGDTEGGNTEGGNTEGGNTEGGGTEGGNTEGGGTEGGETEGGEPEGGEPEGGEPEGGETEGGDGEGGEGEDDLLVTPNGTMSHICTVCGYKETVSVLPDLDGKDRVGFLTIQMNAPLAGEAPSAPYLYDTMHSSAVTLESYEWKDADGESLTAFSADGNNLLTVVLKLKNSETHLFDKNTLVTSPYGTVTSSEISDDGMTLTVTIAVTVCSRPSISGSLPAASVGASILSSMPNFGDLAPLTVVWYQDGKSIGSYTMNGYNRSDVLDTDPDDGIDFLTATFAVGHVYHCHILWDFKDTNLFIDADMLSLSGSTPTKTTVQDGISGFYNVAYALIPSDHVIRAGAVSGIDAPEAGKTPDTSGTLPSGAAYKIKSVVWNTSSFACGGSYTVTVTLSPNSGYRFAPTDGKVHSINGIAASASMSGSNLVLSYTFPTLSHAFDSRSVEKILPTCDTQGSVTISCKYCDLSSVNTIASHGHRLVYVPSSPATCAENGLAKHYRCADCLQLFTDDSATVLTTKEQLILTKDPSAHQFSETAVHDGSSHYQLCLICHEARQGEAPHAYGEWLTASDNTLYHACDCGHRVGQDGPRQPSFRVNGDEDPNQSLESDNENGSSSQSSLMKKVKTFVILFAFLVLAMLIAIVVLIVLLVLNRRSEKALPPLDGQDVAPSVSIAPEKAQESAEETTESEVDSSLTSK